MANIKYLIPQEVDERWGLVTTTVGMQEGEAGTPYPYGEHPRNYYFTHEHGRVLNEYTLVYITKGSGWLETHHCKRTEIHGGDVFLLFPGEWHNYSANIETGWTEAWIGFTGQLVDYLAGQQFFPRESPVIHVGVNEQLMDAFDRACKVAISQPPAYQQQLSGYVFFLLSSIYSISKQPSGLNDTTLCQIIQAKQFMNEHASEVLRMEDVAAHVGMGYSKFRKLFRNYTGFSPQQYFLNLKLEESKDLLLSTSLSSKEIAFRLGFDSASHFNRIFNQHQKRTPIEFRNSISKDYTAR